MLREMIAAALAVGMAGCSFAMAHNRLRAPPAPGLPPQCSTTSVLPATDGAIALAGLAVGLRFAVEGARVEDVEGGDADVERFRDYAIGATAILAAAGFAFASYTGFRWHLECRDAHRKYQSP